MGKRYVSVCELPSAMVTLSIIESEQHTILLRFENEHAEYELTFTHDDAEQLIAHIGAAASSAESGSCTRRFDALAELDRLAARLALCEEELRLREASQIPVIPSAASDLLAAWERYAGELRAAAEGHVCFSTAETTGREGTAFCALCAALSLPSPGGKEQG